MRVRGSREGERSRRARESEGGKAIGRSSDFHPGGGKKLPRWGKIYPAGMERTKVTNVGRSDQVSTSGVISKFRFAQTTLV